MYSAIAQEHFTNPRRAGTLPDADAVGHGGVPGAGPYIVLYVKAADGVVTDARFQTYGCPAAIACGSWVAEWIVGRGVADAAMLTAANVEAGLGGLPPEKTHCAPLAVAAARDAVGRVRVGADAAIAGIGTQ